MTTTTTASPELLEHLTATLTDLRPDWEPGLVRIALQSHTHHVDAADLAVAAVRCATANTRPPPKAIGWRGPHWAGLATTPPAAAPRAWCGICSNPKTDAPSSAGPTTTTPSSPPAPRPADDRHHHGAGRLR